MLEMFFAVLAGCVALPVLVLTMEIALSLVARKRIVPKKEIFLSRPSIAVLVPAYNEGAVISQTLAEINAQLRETDKLLVVADNCDDNTAEIAKISGAIVLERVDPEKRGKGFALDHGIQFLAQNPPDVVIIVDADCAIGPELIEYISVLSVFENRPVQALYLMKSEDLNPPFSKRIAEFAWRVKNHVRPLGQKFLGMPCQLMGTGMAIPFKQLIKVKFDCTNIVEDMQLGIDLTSAGYPPLFCPEVRVTSQFPDARHATDSQRRRWEHGHLGMIIGQAPAILMKSIAHKNMSLFVLTLDLIIPPLTLLAILVLLIFGVSIAAMLVGDVYVAFYLSGITLILFVASVFVAWMGYGRNLLSFREILLSPIKIILKIPFYLQFIANRQKKWIRTDRD